MDADQNIRAIVARELSQMSWDHPHAKRSIVEHFRMAPTVREMLDARLPDTRFASADAVLRAIPDSAWEDAQQVITQGLPASHFRDSLTARTPPAPEIDRRART